MRLKLAITTLMLALLPAAASQAAGPWPPAKGGGSLFAHFGEEHWNDADGGTLLPKVVEQTARYKPALVTMSGDKPNDGTVDQLLRWKQIMGSYDKAGIPYFAAVGNHDRKTPPGALPGATPVGDLANYRQVFADRPYPFGDAPVYSNPRIGPRARPAGDPAGASSHYFVDYGDVRWIFIDNSCYGIVNCDPLQNPPDGNGETQYEYLERHAREAAGRLVFVVTHMPTQDPRDQSYADPTSVMHTMGKGSSPDNAGFEQRAAQLGVDGVFVAHIKGQFLYKGSGGIPYFIDGGAGGELYTTGPVGADHGYWHGYRLIRTQGPNRFTTDSVPIFVPGGIKINGPGRLAAGATQRFEAFGRQPVFNDPAKVPALELRDPDPVRPSGIGLAGFMRGGGLFLMPVLLLLLAGVVTRGGFTLPRRRLRLAVPALALLAAGSLAAVSAAQRSEPTTTPRESLPNPARIWTTGDRFVLSPVASNSEDPRRDPRTQTHDGSFRARCPGRTRVRITSGFESARHGVVVPSRKGRIQRSVRIRRAALGAGRKTRVARVRLAQPAELLVRVRRGGKTLRTLRRGCFGAKRSLSFFWDGRLASRGKLRKARAARYRIDVQVLSDRKRLRRARLVRLRRK